MPLREDLLTPIAGENPSGEDLYYDKVFAQIKEARKEDAEDLPEGAWEVSQKKKADHRAVIKMAGEALAKKSKDLRLASWLVESQLRVDGLSILSPGIELLRSIQETSGTPSIHSSKRATILRCACSRWRELPR